MLLLFLLLLVVLVVVVTVIVIITAIIKPSRNPFHLSGQCNSKGEVREHSEETVSILLLRLVPTGNCLKSFVQ